MKRALSLILAVVMVALMIPFAAIIASATEEETPSGSPLVFDLPEGWVMSKDDGVGAANTVDANGVTLGSANQAIAMTEKVGIGQKRVITVDYGIATKAKLIHFTWEQNMPVAGTTLQADNESGTGGNDLFLCVLGGSTSPVTDGASFGWKVSTSESGGSWLNSGSNATGYYRETVDGEFTSAAIRRWTIGNNKGTPDNTWGASMKALYDGALGTNGTKMTVYIELDENNYITGTYMQTVLYDAEGNFVRENVVYTENDNAYKASCDGYFTIGNTGWGSNPEITIKSVSINAGTAKEMGEVLHSTDFQAYGAENVQKVEMPSSPVATLPEGWVISTDDGVGAANTVDANGVTLGSANQAIAMTEKVGIGQKRVITVDYGIATKAKLIHFTWEQNMPVAGTTLQADNESGTGGNDLFLCVLGGSTSPVTDGASFGWKVSTSESGGSWLNSGSNATGYYRETVDGEFTSAAIRRWTIGNNKGTPDNTWGASMKALYDGALGTNGTKMTVYIELDENNYITGTYMQTVLYDAEGNFVRENVVYTENDNAYKASCDGYFTIGNTGWGSNPEITIKSVSINAGTAKEMGEVLHSTDFQAYGAENVQNAADYFVYMNNVADTTTIATGEASLRVIEEENGIRFTSKFDAADLQLLVNLYEAGAVSKVEVGTLITTKDWAEAAGAVTHAALDAKAGDKTAYVEVMATVGDWYADNTFAGTISNVSAEREYQAAGFIRITLANDEVVFVYSAVTAATLASVTPVEA